MCQARRVDHRTAIDLAMLVLRAATEVVDGIQDGMAARGYADLRPVHGFAFARIAAGDTTVVDLAEHLGTTKQAASQLVAGLVARGYVVREADPRDARARLLRLTERGEACTRAAEEAAAEVVAGWGDVLPGASLGALHAMLRRVVGPGPLRPAW
jgi:DNA-binding MarR family transcriptional regulator